MEIIKSVLGKLLAREPSPDDLRPQHTKQHTLFDLPPELLLGTLQRLRPFEILSFGLACKNFYELCLPALNYSLVISQQGSVEFLRRVSQNDIRNSFVRKVQLGRLDRVGHAGWWNMSHALRFLAAYPHLLEVETCGRTYIWGWDGLDEVARVLGDRLIRLHALLRPPLTSQSPMVSILVLRYVSEAMKHP